MGLISRVSSRTYRSFSYSLLTLLKSKWATKISSHQHHSRDGRRHSTPTLLGDDTTSPWSSTLLYGEASAPCLSRARSATCSARTAVQPSTKFNSMSLRLSQHHVPEILASQPSRSKQR